MLSKWSDGPQQEKGALEEQFLNKHIRVAFEIDEKQTFLGEYGTCCKVDEKAKTISFVADKIAGTVPAKAVQVIPVRQCKVQPYFNFARVSANAKQCMLMALGYWDHAAAAPIETVTQKRPTMLEDQHLKLWSVVLQWTFPNAKFTMLDPQCFLRRLLGKDAEESEAVKKDLEQRLKKTCELNELLLLPIQCPEMAEHPEGHWTLLSVHNPKGGGKAQVRYYESLNEFNEICISKALRICEILGLGQDLVRHNEFRQTGVECCEVVMHYMEAELRQMVGEGWGSVPPLHPKHSQQIRACLSRFSQTLEAHRLQWCKAMIAEEIGKEQMRKWIEAKAGKANVLEVELRRIRKLSKAVAEICTHHANIPGFVLPQPEPKPKSSNSGEPSQKKAKQDKVKPGEPSQAKQEEPGQPGEEPWGQEAGQPGEAAQKGEAGQPGEAGQTGEAGQKAAAGQPGEAAQPGEAGQTGEAGQKAAAGQPGEAAQPVEAGQPGEAGHFEMPGEEQDQPNELTPEQIVSKAAKEHQKNNMKQIVVLDDEPAAETLEAEQKLAELAAGEASIQKWLSGLSQPQKEQIIDLLLTRDWFEEPQEVLAYMQYMSNCEKPQGCGKCRYSKGCEACSLGNAQNYVIKHGKAPQFWMRHRKGLLRYPGQNENRVMRIQAIYIYIYIYNKYQ